MPQVVQRDNTSLNRRDMETAFTEIEGITAENINNDATLSGGTFYSGVHAWPNTGISMTGDIYINGTATDVFIFKTNGTLTVAPGNKVILQDGALASNVCWKVAGAVSVGAGADFEGTILAKTAVTFITGSSLKGRILSQENVALQKATITKL